MIITGLLAEEYHARPELNFSRLKRIARSPFHFRNAPKETSAGFSLGSAAHTAILEPDLFQKRYQRQKIRKSQNGSGDTTIRLGKAWEAELAEATAAGREILTPAEYDKARHLADMIGSKPATRRLLLGASKELTVVSQLQGVPVRCRIDFVQPGHAMGDLKTCRDLSRFASDVERYMYLAQAAFYSDIWREDTGEKLPWKWLGIESGAPNDSAVIAASEQDLDAGRAMYQGWMERHARCLERGEWPGVDQGADEVPLVRPHWATLGSEEVFEETDNDE